ncbi:MAG: HAD hydrolase-like protein, partial [Rhodospirillales bacterium]|nr:HAD hydrolase-like protein [Rhodospirillales bacterium]
MSAFQAVVFDLDGTLIDSIPDVVAAMNQLLVEEGRRPISLDEGKSMVGEGPGPMIRDAVALTGT